MEIVKITNQLTLNVRFFKISKRKVNLTTCSTSYRQNILKLPALSILQGTGARQVPPKKLSLLS